MARRPDRNQNISAPADSSRPRRDPPRENMPRGTFRVAQNLRTLADSMPNLLTDKAVRSAKAHTVQTSPVRSPVAKVSAVATQKPDQRPANRAEPDAANKRPDRTCKRRPSSTKGNGSGRPFVPWCK